MANTRAFSIAYLGTHRATVYGLAAVIISAVPAVCAQGAAPASADAGGEQFRGRGVYYFDGVVRCPLAGIGSRGANASNRVALDDEFSSAQIDRAAHRIVLTNAHRYARRQIIGDVLLLAIGTTSAGARVPVGVHLKIEKQGDRFRAAVHPHPTVRDRIVAAEYEPFTVVLSNGKSDSVALTADSTMEAIRNPGLTSRLANIFVQVTDYLDGVPLIPTQPDARLVDLAVGFGINALNLKVARIELISLAAANAPLITRGAVGEMLHGGAWELRITSLTPFMPREEFDRDFFLLGLDHLPVLRPVIEHGLKQGERVVVGYRDGKGFIGVGSATTEIPNPADVARAYMEFTFVGGLLAHQLGSLTQRAHAETGAGASPAPP